MPWRLNRVKAAGECGVVDGCVVLLCDEYCYGVL